MQLDKATDTQERALHGATERRMLAAIFALHACQYRQEAGMVEQRLIMVNGAKELRYLSGAPHSGVNVLFVQCFLRQDGIAMSIV